MFEINARASYNSIVWISLVAADERGLSNRLFESIEDEVRSFELRPNFFDVETADGFSRLMASIARQAKNRDASPILVIDAHGSQDRGLLVGASGEYIDWNTANDLMKEINIGTENNLIVLFLTCYAYNINRSVRLDSVTPYFYSLAPASEIKVRQIEKGLPIFFNKLLGGDDIRSAHKASFSSSMLEYSCHRIFFLAIVGYVRDYCIGNRARERAKRLTVRKIEYDGLPNTRPVRRRVEKEMRVQLRPQQKIIDRYEQSFLLGQPAQFSIRDVMSHVRRAR